MTRSPVSIREVPDVPYRGKRPPLPKGLSPETAKWWDAVTRLPHVILWAAADWEVALLAARLHSRFVRTGTGANELRLREAMLGTTPDTRAKLRIVYVDPTAAKPSKAPTAYFKPPPPPSDTPHLLPDGTLWSPESARRWSKERKQRVLNANPSTSDWKGSD